jgi:hypothetical protein
MLMAGFMSSCEKPEEPIAPATVQGQTANLGVFYEYQEYYNILSNQFVLNQDHAGWDLSFESDANGEFIYLNSSNFMYVRNAGDVAFESVLDTNYSGPWRYDFPTGQANRLAFGYWFKTDKTSKNDIYIVNQGKSADGSDIGFFKIQIISVNSTEYVIRTARLDNSEDQTITIVKNPDKRWVQYKFGDSSSIEKEPNSENWHLLFSQYTDYDLTDQADTISYLVRGVLLNQKNIQAVLVNNVDFQDIDINLVPQLNFTSDFNAIGYDWKFFSLDTGVYTIKEGMSYVIKEKQGTYFKLRFLGFYSEDGDKGYPSFEIISL